MLHLAKKFSEEPDDFSLCWSREPRGSGEEGGREAKAKATEATQKLKAALQVVQAKCDERAKAEATAKTSVEAVAVHLGQLQDVCLK